MPGGWWFPIVPTNVETLVRGSRATPVTVGEARTGTAVDADAVVRAEHLTKRFGDLVAVDDLGFTLGRGTVTGFLGPNGAGKTTTLRMLLGLVEPTTGRALVLGDCYAKLDRPADRVGAVLEAADFHPGRSGRDHLCALALALGQGAGADSSFRGRERSARQRADAALELVELSRAARRRVGSYSLGMRQRLGLAGALLGDPELLILDEPANGLDPEGVRWLRGFLRGFAAEGKTVVVSSHALAEVEQTVDQVLIINKGRLVDFSPLPELTARLSGGVRVRAPGAARLQSALASEGISSTLDGAGELRVDAASSARVGEIAYRCGVPLHELVPETSTLEDVFLELTTEETT